MLKIVRVTSRLDRKEFTDLPESLYRDYPLWVPPFSHEMKALLKSRGSQLLANGPHVFSSRRMITKLREESPLA